MTPNTTAAWRRRPVMRPNIHTQAIGSTTIAIVVNTFVQKVGFSNGCVLLGPKNPPPFVPSCFTARNAATGPRAMTCSAPSSVVALTDPCSVIGTPATTSTSASTTQHGSMTRNAARCTSTRKLPIGLPTSPRAIATSAARPTAGDTNCSHIRPQSCDR